MKASDSTNSQIMQQVLISLLPGMAIMSWLAPSWIFVLCLATTGALITEYACVTLRTTAFNARRSLADRSALVTGVLIGLCLPASAPWWLALLAGAIAIGLGKQVYGGLGANPFNPAMVSYLVLLLGFPGPMSQWGLDAEGMTGPTLLDRAQTLETSAWPLTEAFFWAQILGGAFALGGLWLIRQGVMKRRIPATMLIGFAIANLCIELNAGTSLVNAMINTSIHFWLGGLIFGAFYIATDPVSAPKDNRAQAVYGLAVGIITAMIRAGAHYPEGVAFAVICGNSIAPTLDRLFTQMPPKPGVR